MTMMMTNSEAPRSHPTVHVPPCYLLDDPTANLNSRGIPVSLNGTATSPTSDNTTNCASPYDGLTALRRYLPSNSDSDFQSEEYGILVDASACEYFRMFEFKLRVLPQISDSYDGSPSRLGFDSFGSSPTSSLCSPPDSPPMSPSVSLGATSVSELSTLMLNLQIGSMRMSMSPPSWGIRMGSGSPRSPAIVGPGFLSLPSTPTRTLTRSGLGAFDLWDQTREEEPAMERVESGRDLRARMYAKLSKENSLDRVDSVSACPDLGWVSELVK
ncbi:hypothetical protein Acr_26g0004690 [Actinidia rufa]|uniref:Uncharacterized protein n=1 Tax=Actinidia rufa TaxID=165716 RepID=A0A7J0H2B8_9ERIC|nr:hypothetical protein Acr_26g0004690 [Actinidia rufa]